MEKIYLLDLNYTLVSNQKDTRLLRPFSRRMEHEEYRQDLVEAIKNDRVIMITARPNYQCDESLANVKKKTGWLPDEWHFNDGNYEPPAFKEKALNRYVFPKYGKNKENYEFIAIESNPKTRAMYSRYGITAMPYEKFIKGLNNGKSESEEGQCDPYFQMELF